LKHLTRQIDRILTKMNRKDMKREKEKIVKGFFPKGFTDRERAVFEAGIALGAIAHAVAGLPITRETAKDVEQALEKSFALQPYREKVRIRIRPRRGRKKSEYDYDSLSPEIMDVRVIVRYGGARVFARMRYVKDIDYPLMYIERIVGVKD